MRIVRDFVYRENTWTGIEGLQPTWFDNAEPVNGRVVAHDILDHFRSQGSPVEGECEALGAALALRLQYLDPSLGQPLKTDVIQILLDTLGNDLPVPAARRSKPLEDESIDQLIVSGVVAGFESASRELSSESYPQEAIERLLRKSTQNAFIGLIRRGYRKALHRFRACDLYTVGHDVFELIEKSADRLLSSEQLVLEDRIRFSVDLRRGGLDVRVNGYCAYEHGYL